MAAPARLPWRHPTAGAVTVAAGRTQLRLAFHGGAGTVTGSKILLEVGDQRVLIDCGMFQGYKELRERNWRPPPFPPASVGHVVLTHAHIDHTGYLPKLVREGFKGGVHCTPATKDVTAVLLADSAKIQEEDADYANRKGHSKHKPALPLYTERDAEHAARLFRSLPYKESLQLEPGITLRLHNAGHIIGSAFAEMRVEEAGAREFTVVFSGDLGGYDAPLHADPEPPPACDVMMLECTYGDRLHIRTPLVEQLQTPFRAAVARGGTILVPAFAVARSQILAMELRALMDRGDIPDLPIHVDSPMATRVTSIYRRYVNTAEMDATAGSADGGFLPGVQFHNTVAESKQLNE